MKSIIELWKTIVLCNPSLIDAFYEWKRDEDELKEILIIHNAEE
jgi:hypothetical protein